MSLLFVITFFSPLVTLFCIRDLLTLTADRSHIFVGLHLFIANALLAYVIYIDVRLFYECLLFSSCVNMLLPNLS